MPKTIFDAQLLSLIPKTMAGEPEIQAACVALDAMNDFVASAVKKALALADIDDLQEDAVDLLALETHADYYNQSLPLQTRRNIVKSSGFIHRFQGTPASIERLTSTVLGMSIVKEWFEYGGAAYTYRLLTTNNSVDEDQYQEILRMLTATVNARSHLDGFYYYGLYNVPTICSVKKISEVFQFPLCGTKPKPAMVGHIEHVTVSVANWISNKAFDYARCGAVLTGALPQRSTLGVMVPVKIGIPSKINSRAFEFTLCGTTVAGKLPGSSTFGTSIVIIATVIPATVTKIINYVRCGTNKVSVNFKNALN